MKGSSFCWHRSAIGTAVRVVSAACLLVRCGAAAAQTAPADQTESGAHAPVTSSELPEVVVTATRTQTRLEDSTASVSVLSGNDIKERDETMAADALRGLPGMDVNNFGSPGQTAFASIRGSSPDQVLVLLDGVEVNTTTVGQFDFANLTTDNLNRIEVLRGGGGTLYGSEAIGGVVNVLTQRGEGPFHVLASGEAGSAATHHESVGINGAQGPFALSGTASFLASDGFRSINDDYRNFSTVWRSDLDILPAGTLRGFLRYSESRTGLVNFNVYQNVLDPYAYARDNFFLAKGEWEHAPTDTFNYRTAVSFVRDNPRYRDDMVDDEGEVEPVVISHTPSEQIAAEVQANARWPECALTTVGLEYKEQWAEFDEFGADTEDAPDWARAADLRLRALQPSAVVRADDETGSASVRRANRSIVGAYGQEQLQLLDDTLRGVGGIRYDHYDVFGDHVTVSGSGSYLIRPTQTRLRVGYAEGFRAPAFDELFGPLGNSTLKPETSWEIDAGLTQDVFGGRLRFEPTYFYREVHNLIEEVEDELPPVAGVPEEERAGNASTRMQGVELITRLQPTQWLTLAGNYTYLNFVTPGESPPSRGTLVNRPRHRGSASATGHWDNLFAAGDRATFSTMVYLVGHRDSPNPFNTDEPFSPAPIAGYTRVDLALAYHFGGRLSPLSVTATARNLFNRDYAESIGFPAPPANFLVGFRYTLG